MENDYDVAVIGLGYVGLTLATVLAGVGARVVGVERRPEIVELTNKGNPHFVEQGLSDSLSRVLKAGRFLAVSELRRDVSAGVYIITVGTPLKPNGETRVDMIEAAAREVGANMRPNALVILRSTVKIGTTRDVVTPILCATGKSFEIAMCPERTLEGRALEELRELPQIVGADTQTARDRASSLFRKLTKSIVEVSSLEAAEIVKLVDNTYRDVTFAFANEVARVCEAFGVSAHEVITSGKLGYVRTNVALPGPVGGPCLEKDPHILMQSAASRGIELEVAGAGRLVNERQPQESVGFILNECKRRGLPRGAKVTLMGMAFKGKPATDDLRGSMAIKVLEQLQGADYNFALSLYDPVITPDELRRRFPDVMSVHRTIEDAYKGADVVFIANNHPAMAKYLPAEAAEMMNPRGFIYDYWNHFSNMNAIELSGMYYAVGNIGRIG